MPFARANASILSQRGQRRSAILAALCTPQTVSQIMPAAITPAMTPKTIPYAEPLCAPTIRLSHPRMACQVIDWAIQAHGAAGVSDDFNLAFHYAQARTLHFADGPDEVHRNAIAKQELARYK